MKSAVAHFVDGRLFSPEFNDYYAARDPVVEAAHVHIEPANLISRMRRAKTFSIFEFGFGAGINFLKISEEFQKCANSDTRLRFVSCEAFPLQSHVIREAHEGVSVDKSLSRQLLDFYPPLISGIYRRLFADDRVELTLIFTDIATALSEFTEQDRVGVDSWILDGFAPDRNPHMWDVKLLSTLAQHTRTNGTVTSFSSAGNVRRSLTDNGFSVRRIEDTPFKRHTILATLDKQKFHPRAPPKEITVVGGGFAGTATARALARRGVHVQLMTPTGTVGNATSGIPTAVLHPRLSASMDTPAYVRTQTYFFTVPNMDNYLVRPTRGVVQLAGKNMPESRLKDIFDMLSENWITWIGATEFRELTGMNYGSEAALFPMSFVVNGRDMCHTLADHLKIEVVAKDLHAPIPDTTVIYATGSTSLLGELANSWESLTIEGQTDSFTHANHTAIPRITTIQDGYIVPTSSGCVVGSTYEYTKWKPGLATSTNLGKLEQTTNQKNWSHNESFRGERTVTSDKLPIVGQVSPNVWVNLAHGSAGTSSTPYCGEILASQLSGELAPLWQECVDTLLPTRFKERQVRRPNPLQQPRH